MTIKFYIWIPHNYQIQFIWFLCTQCVIYWLIVRGRNTPFTSVSLALPHRQCCAQKVDSSGRLKPCLCSYPDELSACVLYIVIALYYFIFVLKIFVWISSSWYYNNHLSLFFCWLVMSLEYELGYDRILNVWTFILSFTTVIS